MASNHERQLDTIALTASDLKVKIENMESRLGIESQPWNVGLNHQEDSLNQTNARVIDFASMDKEVGEMLELIKPYLESK